jgi:hypothetical protein
MDWRFGSSCRVPVSQAQSPEFKLESYQKREWNGGASEVNEGVKIIKEHFLETGGVAQAVEHLPCKHKAQIQTPVLEKRKKERKKSSWVLVAHTCNHRYLGS